jgi:hypothetical protein
MPAPVASAAIMGGSNLLGKAIGGDGTPKPAKTPRDLLPMRQSNIGLLNYLLGFNQPGMPWSQQQGPASGNPYRSGSGQVNAGGGSVFNPQFQNPANPGRGSDWGPTFQGPQFPQGRQPGNQPGGGPNITPGSHPSFSMGGMPTQQPGGPQALYGGGPNIGPGMPGVSAYQNPMNAGGGYGMTPGGFNTQLQQGQATSPMQQRIESYFGQLGTPTSALQQQSLGGISQFLGSNPYGQSNDALSQIMGSQGRDFFGSAQGAFNDVKNANYFGKASGQADKVAGANYFGKASGAFDQLAKGNYFGDAEGTFKRLENYNPFQPAQGMLEGMFAQNPGQGVANSLQPLYDRALAQANQEGGRFGSANAILRSRALDDYNISMQQALQRGVDQQIQGAGVYGGMGNSLIGARQAAGQGLLGVGQGRMQQQGTAAQGMLGVGQGQLQQGLGAGQLMLGVGQGQLSQGLGAAQGMLGVGQGRSSYDLGNTQNRLAAAGQMANNQNSYFGNLAGGYGIGQAQAQQEAERQQQALQILAGLLGTSQGASLQGTGG